MGEEEAAPATAPAPAPAPATPTKEWRAYISEELPRTIQESADSAILSARSLQDFIPQIATQYRYYEEAFFGKVKDELVNLREHPALVAGVAITSCLVLLPGPRRFLVRQTLGRLQSEEAQFVRAENNVKELSLSVDLMKRESKKLLERSVLAEKDMRRGLSDLRDAGNQIQSLSRSVYKAEAEASGLMDLLREIPGREALKLRADVASMASHLRQQRSEMNKKILKISELDSREEPPPMPPKEGRFEVINGGFAAKPKELLERSIGFTINYSREDENDP